MKVGFASAFFLSSISQQYAHQNHKLNHEKCLDLPPLSAPNHEPQPSFSTLLNIMGMLDPEYLPPYNQTLTACRACTLSAIYDGFESQRFINHSFNRSCDDFTPIRMAEERINQYVDLFCIMRNDTVLPNKTIEELIYQKNHSEIQNFLLNQYFGCENNSIESAKLKNHVGFNQTELNSNHHSESREQIYLLVALFILTMMFFIRLKSYIYFSENKVVPMNNNPKPKVTDRENKRNTKVAPEFYGI
ncbi:MAG: hypothetical protein VW397_01050 [Candidatus Margulisiibacteriota bacterium]